MRYALAVLLVLAAASAASADMVLEVTRNADPQVGLESYTLTFKGVMPGERFSAFDGALRGPMSQTWYFKGKYWTTEWVGDFFLPVEVPDAALDSHLLVDEISSLVAVGPHEDADTSTSFGTTPAGYERFLGTYLASSATSNMAFAVPVLHQQLVQPFAQVVIPAGQMVRLTGTAVSYDGRGLPLDVEIPEPATLALLGVGAIALLRRRRARKRGLGGAAQAPLALKLTCSRSGSVW